ncbi:hypothetical protein D3C86_1457680 [compost metagenome]
MSANMSRGGVVESALFVLLEKSIIEIDRIVPHQGIRTRVSHGLNVTMPQNAISSLLGT